MKTLLIVLLTLATATVAGAAAKNNSSKASAKPAPMKMTPSVTTYSRPYGMAGCGLGHFVVGKQGSQILSGTTNGTAWNQSFGITFGTLDCEDGEKLASTATRLDNFISTNKVAVASDAAKGQGETVTVLAKLMNCSDSANLGASLQNHFGSIFSRYDLTANEITDHLLSVVVSDRNLAEQCQVKI